MPEKTATEKLIRQLINGIRNIDGKDTMAIIGLLVPVLGSVPQVQAEFSGKSREELAELIRSTLDNLVGSEPDALIGEAGELINGDLPFVGPELIEQVTDVIFGIVAGKIADAIVAE